MKRGLVYFLVAVLALFCLVVVRAQSDLRDLELRDEIDADGDNSTVASCESKTKCDECTDDKSCIWCESKTDLGCKAGSWLGPDEDRFTGCKDWRWKQCHFNGRWLFFGAIGAAIGLVLLCCFFLFICYCFASYRRRDRIYRRQKTFEQEEMERTLLETRTSKTPKNDARRAEIYAKYGTPEERAAKKRGETSVFSL
eukprot:TRINITY_DN1674_c0_g1_i1.p1 TRINITY_DN1674_c0_g1~~TRINITY_DN1674_c0_g1_i1.p1  ORF type:complete len:197 (+),score=18.42 TRINITY_DN1674_c0_g1_i1:26-616(+)